MIGRGRWSTVNRARYLDFIVLLEGICINQNLNRRMRRKTISDILRYKHITECLARRPDIVIVNKKTIYRIMSFALPANYRAKMKENKINPKRQIFRSCQRIKRALEHEGDSDTNCNWCTWNVPQSKMDGRVRNWRASKDHLDNSIVEVSQNIEKSPGDLNRLAVTLISVKDHQLMLVGKKTRKK